MGKVVPSPSPNTQVNVGNAPEFAYFVATVCISTIEELILKGFKNLFSILKCPGLGSCLIFSKAICPEIYYGGPRVLDCI
jgi:hypothetical protein